MVQRVLLFQSIKLTFNFQSLDRLSPGPLFALSATILLSFGDVENVVFDFSHDFRALLRFSSPLLKCPNRFQ